MRVLICIPTSLFGGAEKVALYHAKYYLSMAWDVQLLVWSDSSGSLEKYFRELRVPIIHWSQLDGEKFIHKLVDDNITHVYLAAPMKYTVTLCDKARYIGWRGKIFMVVHNDSPIVIQNHVLDYGDKLNCCVVVHEGIEHAIRQAGSSVPVHLLHNAVDRRIFYSDDMVRMRVRKKYGISDELVLYCLGRIDANKYLDGAILVAEYMREEYALKIKLVIIGDSNMPAHWDNREKVLKLGHQKLGDDLLFMGYTPNPELYIQMGDIHLSTSYSEGLSMGILESMSCGRPVVATDVGGNKYAIQSAGHLVKTNDDILEGWHQDDIIRFAEATLDIYRRYDIYSERASLQAKKFDTIDNRHKFEVIMRGL